MLQSVLRVSLPALLDLDAFKENERASVWTNSAQKMFPGLMVEGLPRLPVYGAVSQLALATGSVSHIHTPPVRLHFAPPACGDVPDPCLSILLNLEGPLVAAQGEREVSLAPGDLCLIDEQYPFRLESRKPGELIVLRLPRPAVLNRHPHLAQRTAIAGNVEDVPSSHLRDLILRTLKLAAYLSSQRRVAVVSTFIEMLSLVDFPLAAAEGRGIHWRVSAALSYIELTLFDSRLTATTVAQAQRIGRRRLDDLFKQAVGVSITAHIWDRRLALSALYLSDPGRTGLPIGQIARSTGFRDPAHFARAFKRRYDCWPSVWRESQSRIDSERIPY